MRDLMTHIFRLSKYTGPLERRRAASAYVVSTLLLAALVLGAISALLRALGGQLAVAELPGLVLVGGLGLGVALAAIFFTRRRQQTIGALILVGAWFVMIAGLLLMNQIALQVAFAAMLVGISLATLLIGHWTILYAGVFTALVLFARIWFDPALTPAEGRDLLAINLALLVVLCGVNYALAQSLHSAARQITAAKEQRNMRLAGASAALARRLLIARMDLNTLLEETVRLVRDTFDDANEVQLFLVDMDRKSATLVASTNQSGGPPVGHQVGVGSLNVIGRVTVSGQQVIVRDTPEEQSFRRSAFLEGTRAELVLPLRVGNETIGALDLQSKNIEAFQPEDIETCETLANQIAVAIDNARLFADAQARLAENQRLYEQASASLREIERLNQQLTGGAWAEYLRGLPQTPAYTVDPSTGRVEDAAERTATMSEAIRRAQVITRSNPTNKVVCFPISVRGQVIGAMEFELSPDQYLGPDHLVILRQVVERLGLAAENIRLLDEAQRIAQREAMVNEITARMQAATNVESVIAAATQSLADAFEAPRVAIRLGVPASGKNGDKAAGG